MKMATKETVVKYIVEDALGKYDYYTLESAVHFVRECVEVFEENALDIKITKLIYDEFGNTIQETRIF